MKASVARAHVEKIRKLPSKSQGSESTRVLKQTENELEKIYARIEKVALRGEFHIRQSFKIVDTNSIFVVDNIVHTLIREGYHVSITPDGFTTNLDINWD